MKHLLLDTNGLIIKKRNNCFFVISKKAKRMISPLKVQSIIITADILMSSSAFKLAISHQIPVYYTDKTGNIFAKIYSKFFVAEAELRQKQVLWSLSGKARQWIIDIIKIKMDNQLSLLRSKKIEVKEFDYNKFFNNIVINDPDFFKMIRILEAKQSKKYWKNYRSLLPPDIIMQSRSQRPAQDNVNTCLNYFYGFLYSLMEQALWSNGLSPYIAVMHNYQYNKPVLSFDLIEAFRVIVDAFVLEMILNKKITSNMFKKTSKSIYLSKQGKKVLIPLFLEVLEKPVKFSGYKTSWINHIYRFSYKMKTSVKTQKIPENEIFDLL